MSFDNDLYLIGVFVRIELDGSEHVVVTFLEQSEVAVEHFQKSKSFEFSRFVYVITHYKYKLI